MLKYFFGLLLLLNIGLFALQKGYLDGIYSNGREPERMSTQLAADKIVLLANMPEPSVVTPTDTPAATPTASAADKPVAAAATKPAVVKPAATLAVVSACTEIGNFSAAEARKFASLVAEKIPAITVNRHEAQDVSSYMVYLPSLGSKEAADKKSDELRGLGINDFFVIQDSTSNLRYGISLGIFKTSENANTQIANLAKKGINGAQISPRNSTGGNGKVAFQLHSLTAAAKTELDGIKASFPQQELRSCH